MPLRYQIDDERRVVITTGHGIVNDTEVFEYKQSVWSLPRVAGYDELIDMTDVQRVEVPSTERLRELARLSAAMDVSIPSRLAIVAADPVTYGIAQMYELFRRLDRRSTKTLSVFRSVEEAILWLRPRQLETGRGSGTGRHAAGRKRPDRLRPGSGNVGRGTIMVVEDEPRLRFILERQLRETGFDVIPLESGEEALKMLETRSVDVVVLNVLLTGIDGMAVCERIRADRRLAHLPIMFLTAKKDDETRARCLALGADDYVIKPWDAADLTSRIERLVALARGRR